MINKNAVSYWDYKKSDGRMLRLYSSGSSKPIFLAEKLEESSEGPTIPSHLRWHPLRQEWVAYSAARQNRTFKPPAEFCPLCPSIPGGLQSEIPAQNFEIAVFDNKFPAFQAGAQAIPQNFDIVPVLPAAGKCEVVVYSGKHQGDISTLSEERLKLLLDVWIDRYQNLRGKDGIQFVMPFENRGEEAGVTLHHPHGQIYAFNEVPPLIKTYAESFKKGFSIASLLKNHGDKYEIFNEGKLSSFVPPFSRYPFEIWIGAQRPLPGPWAFDGDEKAAFARLLKKTVGLYDKFFGRVTPYIYVMHAAPIGNDETYQFSAQFYPLLRSKDKLKYLAGCEQGAGLFLNDVMPEDAVSQLRACLKDMK